MKVLQINSVCGIGSTGRIATDIHNVLQQMGHGSFIGFGRGIANNCNTAIRIGGKLDKYIHVGLTRFFDFHGFGSKAATVSFIEQVTAINPDVIHLHNIHGYYLNLDVLFDYLKQANKPVVWTFHDCWPFTGHCAYFDYENCSKWKTKCEKCPQKRSYPKSIILDNSSNNYKKKNELFNSINNLTIVTPSNWLENIVRHSFLNEKKIMTINNGIDLNLFTPTKSDFKIKNGLDGKFIILGVANVWEKRKGLEYFHALASQLDSNQIIVLVGLTPSQISELPSNIIGFERTSSLNELVEIYSSADVFFNPTLEDNFPTTNLEALACGTPIITFNTGGSPESINQKCGRILPKGDLSNIISIMKKINRKLCSDDCIQYSKRFEKNLKYIEYINLYSSLIEQNADLKFNRISIKGD